MLPKLFTFLLLGSAAYAIVPSVKDTDGDYSVGYSPAPGYNTFGQAQQAVYPNCPCIDPKQYCYPECYYNKYRKEHAKDSCRTCKEHPWKSCPPHCSLITTTTTYDYPYATLRATEVCTLTLLNCDKPYQYTQSPQYSYHPKEHNCEYAYPCQYAEPTSVVTIHPIIYANEDRAGPYVVTITPAAVAPVVT